MKKLLIIAVLSFAAASTAAAQTDIKIRKKTEIKMPAMPEISDRDLEKMPEATRRQLKNRLRRESVVYLKGSQMRTDIEADVPSGMKIEKRRFTTIRQCDKQRLIQFDDKKKKYFISRFGGAPPSGGGALGTGSVTIALTVTDTGEKARLFGYDARHLKQTMTITPGAKSCLKSKVRVEFDGWYADMPGFSCPLKPDTKGLADAGCGDEVRYEISGTPVTGVALKEIRVITMDGQTITTTEEAVELTNVALDAAFFEPPAGYTAAGSEAEIETAATTPEMSQMTPQTPATPTGQTAPTVNPTLAPPVAGLTETTLSPKKAGVLRIGIAPPTAEMGKDFQGDDPAVAVRNTIAVALRTERVETVFLESGLLEQEAKQKDCDYIFYSKVGRKKGGGGFLKSIAPMVAGAAAGMIPGAGGIVGAAASTAISTATMAGGFKSKDEISFEYKLAGPGGTSLLAPPATKQKAKKDGEDVLTPQIQQAAAAALAEISKQP